MSFSVVATEGGVRLGNCVWCSRWLQRPLPPLPVPWAGGLGQQGRQGPACRDMNTSCSRSAVSPLRFPFIPESLPLFTGDKNQHSTHSKLQLAESRDSCHRLLGLGWVYGSHTRIRGRDRWSTTTRTLQADMSQWQTCRVFLGMESTGPRTSLASGHHLVFMSGTDGELCSFIAPKFVLAAAIYTQMFQVEPRFPFAFPRVDKLTDFQRES